VTAGLTGRARGYPPGDMVLVLVVVSVLGPFVLALGLLGLTRRCELWLEGDARRLPGVAFAEAAPPVASPADEAAFAA
jgi:hypothetical protein